MDVYDGSHFSTGRNRTAYDGTDREEDDTIVIGSRYRKPEADIVCTFSHTDTSTLETYTNPSRGLRHPLQPKHSTTGSLCYLGSYSPINLLLRIDGQFTCSLV